MANMDVEDFIQQNRALADQVETYRGYWESEKHWEPRREFILRNINDFQLQQLDQLLSLSMVWANNVFMGCRYSTELLDKVKEMAEGIEVEDAPVFKTRDEIMKKQQVSPWAGAHTHTHTHTQRYVDRDNVSCIPRSFHRRVDDGSGVSSILVVSDTED
uniref:CDKN2A interacting protein N-terminal like n=1 Tax=Dicentrarchus labrax TaxID=13489 RepID=A0A8P4GG31_DICLA